jgi:hypothetical protein
MVEKINLGPVSALLLYFRTLVYYIFNPTASLSSFPSASTTPRHVQIHLYNLILNVRLFNSPHYRKATYRMDLRDNLKNVAIPGTGVALSVFVLNKLFLLFFLFAVVPTVCFWSSVNLLLRKSYSFSAASQDFVDSLLCPTDWCSLWRTNCNLVAYHSLRCGNPKGYEMENKWTFLSLGEEAGFPVSPFLPYPSLVVKHRNIEGGMGIHFFSNALSGGDWIIQRRINNSPFVNSLLPDNSPLSTFRIITISRACLKVGSNGRFKSKATPRDVSSLSGVFRAGRANALTDHDSVLFDVDRSTGALRGGTTNKNWYKLGLWNARPGGAPWRSGDDEHRTDTHPDCEGAAAGR